MKPERIAEWKARRADDDPERPWHTMMVEEIDDFIAAAEREDQYAAELDRCCEVLERWDAASGCNGRLCVADHLATLLAVDEREAKLRGYVEKALDGLDECLHLFDNGPTPVSEEIEAVQETLRAAIKTKGDE